MVTASCTHLLRLHVDRDGFVWYGDDDRPASNAHVTAEEFFLSQAFEEELAYAKIIRLIGAKANAPLIVRLHDRRMSEKHFRNKVVEVGSPAAVPTVWLVDDPRAVLHHLWQPAFPSAPGGFWHNLTVADYATYAMIAALGDRPGKAVPEIVRRIAEYHPAWPAITFIRSADRDAACRLLCEIVDPRWYRHPVRPGRLTRLYAHLGLTPENSVAMAGEGQQGIYFNRAATAARVWYNQKVGRPNGYDPRDFLFRTLSAYEPFSRGLLRATQRLLRLVVAVWVDAVAVRPHREGAFDPAQFFQDVREVEAFKIHLDNARRV